MRSSRTRSSASDCPTPSIARPSSTACGSVSASPARSCLTRIRSSTARPWPKQYLEHDVDLANQYLDEAGYAERDADGWRLGPDGKPIRFVFEAIEFRDLGDVAELVTQNWRKVGVDVRYSLIERALHTKKIRANEFDLVIWTGPGGAAGDIYLDPRRYFPSDVFQAEHGNPVGALERRPRGGHRNGAARGREGAVPALGSDQGNHRRRGADEPPQEVVEVIGGAVPRHGNRAAGAEGPCCRRTRSANTPELMLLGWSYPHPAPTNPEQYYYDN